MNSKNILITGGAGFIGSHVVNHFTENYPKYTIVVIDSLTYASNIDNIAKKNKNGISWNDNIKFIKDDIRDVKAIDYIFQNNEITDVIHLAAESHVDNSIENPNIFVETNVMGTVNLLNAAKKYWKLGKKSRNRFYHVSTDEVYGALGLNDKPFTEKTSYDPHSPYSASKASSDHFVRSYHDTYGLQTVISNCSNNYGPHQHTEKLIPKVISNLRDGKLIPVYGKGENIRDWLYVGDHVNAIDNIFHYGTPGETYNIGGDMELTNLELIHMICDVYMSNGYEKDKKLNSGLDIFNKSVEYVKDRAGHDLRYAINCEKLKNQLEWSPTTSFVRGITKTIKYYMEK